MARWRYLTLSLIVVALALWVVLFALNLRPEFARTLPHGLPPAPDTLRLQAPLSRLPGWIASVALYVTLLLAGIISFFLFPFQVRNMSGALERGWSRLLPITLLGIGFTLLTVVFAIGAALARLTFAFTILSALALVLFSSWGFLVAAYALGRLLLGKAGWGAGSPVLALALGLLLLLPLARIPYAGGIVMLIYAGLGLGLVIATHFGSGQPWSLIPLLEEVNE